MKFNKINNQKKNLKKLLKKIYSLNECISVNIVGSFTDNKELNNIGDLDIVIISKKISKNFISNCKALVKKHKFPINKKIKINDTFGPLKYDKKKYLVIHLMIYDINGHIQHVIKSPFTCYDWERKSISHGKSLDEIYSVNTLQLNDFFNSRRAINNHYKDIKKEVISTYSYYFYKKKYKFINKKIKLNKLNKKNYCKHIINHNLNNFNKLITQKNQKISKKDLNKLGSKYKLERYIALLNNSKKLDYIIENTKNFLNHFYNVLSKIRYNSNEVIFMRHAKTNLNKKNVFFGRKQNIGIINFKNRDKFIYDKIFCSPLKRSVETAKKFNTKKILIRNYLNEIDYGFVDGLNLDQLKEKYPKLVNNWNLKKDPRFPGGENLSDISKRVDDFIKILKNNLKNKTNQKYLIVTHNVFLRCLIGKFFNISSYDWFKIKINHLDKIKFNKVNNRLVPNISRKTIKKIMNYKIDEANSLN